MVSNEDIHLVLAYFHLQSRQRYRPHEMASRPTLRARFLKTARQILGEVPPPKLYFDWIRGERPVRGCEHNIGLHY